LRNNQKNKKKLFAEHPELSFHLPKNQKNSGNLLENIINVRTFANNEEENDQQNNRK
jgi:hypothetical protein